MLRKQAAPAPSGLGGVDHAGGPGWLRLTDTGPGLGTRSRDPALSVEPQDHRAPVPEEKSHWAGLGSAQVGCPRMGPSLVGEPSPRLGRLSIQVLAQDPRAETPPPTPS